ncbi:MAG: hypothetical protein LUG44_10055, partial [Clostridiales bacterium]|nr:hypothetical protein [Clostridiales bacterium]
MCALLLSMAMAISCASLPAVAAEVGVSGETVAVSTDTEETTEEESEEDHADEKNTDASAEESTEEEAADSSEEVAISEEEAEESTEEEATVEAAEAEETEEADESVEAESTVPTATAESTLFGYGYTDGLSCLMGSTIDSLTGEATISLALDEGEIDDSLIDSSNATVKLVDGDGYYAAELILSATTLTGNWENGQTSYTMSVEDLVWNNDVYSGTVGDAGTRQRSAFGGDGNGCYTFYLEVSGITYNGQEVASTTFPVEVYIFGRDGTDRGTVFDTEVTLPTATESSSGKSQSIETLWTWSGDSSAGDPILCDSLADDFYITWPSGSDASGVTASDVTATLSNEYGTTYTLETENAYGEQQYAVYSSAGETQVAVTFMHWSYTPVFVSMTITVDGGDGLTATKTYEVASVYAYVIQSGGRARGDGNVVTFSYYGLDLDSLTNVYQLAKDTEDYTLYTTVDDTPYYYAEDENGEGFLPTYEEETPVFRQSADAREPALVNATVFIENRLALTEDKTVDGETVTFTKELGNGDGNNTLYMKGADVLANGVKAATGYVIGENPPPYDGNGDRYGTLMPYEHWAWQTRFSAGWTSEDGTTATSFPYVSFPYGYAAGETPSTGDDEEEEELVEVSVTAESDIFGSADTGNKSTLKAE